jgi:hypothetical protein
MENGPFSEGHRGKTIRIGEAVIATDHISTIAERYRENSIRTSAILVLSERIQNIPRM